MAGHHGAPQRQSGGNKCTSGRGKPGGEESWEFEASESRGRSYPGAEDGQSGCGPEPHGLQPAGASCRRVPAGEDRSHQVVNCSPGLADFGAERQAAAVLLRARAVRPAAWPCFARLVDASPSGHLFFFATSQPASTLQPGATAFRLRKRRRALNDRNCTTESMADRESMSSGAMSHDAAPPPNDINDIEKLAMANLKPVVQTFIQTGYGRGLTVRENRKAFERWHFLPKVLSGSSQRNTQTTLLGRVVSMPVGIAPTAAHCIVHPDAELAVVRAAREARAVMAVSVVHSASLEDMAAAAGPDAVLWAQLDIRKDRSITLEEALRAQRCGFAALVVTLDAPLVGRKAAPGVIDPVTEAFGDIFLRLRGDTPGHEWDPCQSWADIDWLRSKVDLPIVIKGILRAEDAVDAVNHGASAIVVSNHGGLYMDGVPAALDMLPEVVRAVSGRCEVYMDGGVRSGGDVVKALSLGAKAVFIGRPIFYGLGYKGQQGVTEVLECIRRELDNCLALLGCSDVEKLHPGFLRRHTPFIHEYTGVTPADFARSLNL